MTQINTHLVIISAPSGAGKSTLCQKLLKEFPSLRLSISSTTRAPRGNEQNGVEYFFLKKEDFERQIQENQFAEWALVHQNYYGTSKNFIEQAFLSGFSVLLDIDVQGAKQLKNSYPEHCHRIFIAPPSLQELESRLRSRGTDTEEIIQKRLKNAQIEMEAGKQFDHWIVNDTLERAFHELTSLLEKQLYLRKKNG